MVDSIDPDVRRRWQELAEEVLKLATPVKLEWVPSEHEWNTLQSFKFAADTDRDLFVTIRHCWRGAWKWTRRSCGGRT